ncbi:MAG TPA: conjugal transfer protein TraR [Gammaproteobacteria bacterium]|nr:TraR/DksA family transcriptional regulator [Pseudomonadota bacterium]HAY46618.1 conjugal transfer protein TraR [Gammaproteobacteria bacterium]
MDNTLKDKFNKELQSEQERLTALLERTGKHLYKRDEPYSADFAEQAVETENNEVVEALDQENKVALREVKLALDRMEAGEYGNCTECGAAIASDRLFSIPHTRFCISCAQKQ